LRRCREASSFLKKSSKRLLFLCTYTRRQRKAKSKSFLVLFFKKEHSSFLHGSSTPPPVSNRMHLKTYRAGSIVQAMALIRGELGADALILSSRRVAGGVEIAACLEPKEDDFATPPALYQAEEMASASVQPQWLPRPMPRRPQAQAAPDPLAWHGVPPSIATRLGSGPLAHALSETLQFGALPIGEQAPLMLAGAPGAGKTLTTARLATRLVLSGQLPLVISADGRRAGAAEELAAYTRLLGIELIVASKAATIARALPRRAAGAPVLIDTAGINPFDPTHMQTLTALAEAAGAVPVLVLAAGQDSSEAADQAEVFAAAGIRHLIPTRLDIARRLGAVIAAADAGTLTLSEAGTGSGATDGLTQLTPALLADWLGRIPPPKPHA
jgi:flagellar biosynthesis protein FlhF